MWIFLNDSFISVVAHKTDPSHLMVRARRKGDLERVLGPYIKVEVTPDADYAYRCVVSRDLFYKALEDCVNSIDYTNFKNSIEDDDYHEACLSVWGVMRRLQRKAR